MSDVIISLLFGLGAGGWVYGKVYRRTGGLTKHALIVGGGCGAGAFILLWVILSLIF